MIACDRWIPEGSTRNATFITVEGVLPGRVILKELNVRVIKYVPGIEAVAVAVPVRPDENVDVVANSIPLINPNDPVVVDIPIATTQVIGGPLPETVLETSPPSPSPPPSLPPSPPLPPLSPPIPNI